MKNEAGRKGNSPLESARRLVLDPDPEARIKGIGLLHDRYVSDIVDELIRLIDDDSDQVRAEAMRKLRQLKEPRALFALYDAMEDPGLGHHFLDEAVNAVRCIGVCSLDYLQQSLSHPDACHRRMAAGVLGTLRGRSVVDILLSVTFDPDIEVSSAVAQGLAAQRSRRVVPILRDRLATQEDLVRSQAGLTLACMKAPGILSSLRQLVEHGDWRVRQRVVHALGRLETSESVPLLRVALDDMCAPVRSEAAWALGYLATAGAYTRRGHLAVTRIDVRSAFSALKDRLYDPDELVRRQVVFALGNMGVMGEGGVVDLLIVGLQDQEESVRAEAAHGLGLCDDKRATSPLVKALTDPSSEVRANAALALGELKAPGARWPLERALQDDDSSVREAAREALFELH